MIRIFLLLLAFATPVFAADEGVVTDPLADPEPTLGSEAEDPSGGALMPAPRPVPVETAGDELDEADDVKTKPNTAGESSVLTPNEVRQAIAGDDDIFWSLHEGGRNHVQITWVNNGFSDRDYDPSPAVEKNFDAMGAKIQYLHYPFVGRWGRLGAGPSGGYYRVSKNETNTGAIQALAFGAKANYELQFWEAQLLVPFVEVGYERVSLRKYSFKESSAQDAATTNVPASNFASNFYGGGLLLYLNRLETDAGSRAIASSGIKKFYLAYSAEQRDGLAHNLGIRFEF